MDRPDYNGNSIVNLMASILDHFGYPSPYSPLGSEICDKFSDNSSIILIVIDGMGYEYLKEVAPETFISKNLKGKLTSTFPSTTAAAMTSYYTGLAPLNHGVPGWFTYLRELGCIATILPFIVRNFRTKIASTKIKAEDVFKFKSLFENLAIEQNLLLPEKLINLTYGNAVLRARRQIGYNNLENMVDKLIQIANHSTKRHFTLAYFPDLDSVAHDSGIGHKSTLREFMKIDYQIKRLITKLSRDPKVPIDVIISADHGLIDTDHDHTIWLSEHPELEKCLTLPLCGEPRAPFLYIRSTKLEQALSYINQNLSHACELMPSAELIKNNFFGLGEMHPEFESRVGEYILIMKENYILRDALLGEERHQLVGNHGGLSPQELYVPLIIFPKN